ncbi:hypothetical protein P7C70_g6888, partial [Phenoliferia sp. Uapishka_3]
MAQNLNWRPLTLRERFHPLAPHTSTDHVPTLYKPDLPRFDLVGNTSTSNYGLQVIPHSFSTSPEWESDVLTTIAGMRGFCPATARIVEIPTTHRAHLQYGQGRLSHMIAGGAEVDVQGVGRTRINLYGFAEGCYNNPRIAADFSQADFHGYASQRLIELSVEGCGRLRKRGLARLQEIAEEEGGLARCQSPQGKHLYCSHLSKGGADHEERAAALPSATPRPKSPSSPSPVALASERAESASKALVNSTPASPSTAGTHSGPMAPLESAAVAASSVDAPTLTSNSAKPPGVPVKAGDTFLASSLLNSSTPTTSSGSSTSRNPPSQASTTTAKPSSSAPESIGTTPRTRYERKTQQITASTKPAEPTVLGPQTVTPAARANETAPSTPRTSQPAPSASGTSTGGGKSGNGRSRKQRGSPQPARSQPAAIVVSNNTITGSSKLLRTLRERVNYLPKQINSDLVSTPIQGTGASGPASAGSVSGTTGECFVERGQAMAQLTHMNHVLAGATSRKRKPTPPQGGQHSSTAEDFVRNARPRQNAADSTSQGAVVAGINEWRTRTPPSTNPPPYAPPMSRLPPLPIRPANERHLRLREEPLADLPPRPYQDLYRGIGFNDRDRPNYGSYEGERRGGELGLGLPLTLRPSCNGNGYQGGDFLDRYAIPFYYGGSSLFSYTSPYFSLDYHGASIATSRPADAYLGRPADNLRAQYTSATRQPAGPPGQGASAFPSQPSRMQSTSHVRRFEDLQYARQAYLDMMFQAGNLPVSVGGVSIPAPFSRAVSPPPNSRHSLRATASDFVPAVVTTGLPVSTDPRRRPPPPYNPLFQSATHTQPAPPSSTAILVANAAELVTGRVVPQPTQGAAGATMEDGEVVESELGENWSVVGGRKLAGRGVKQENIRLSSETHASFKLSSNPFFVLQSVPAPVVAGPSRPALHRAAPYVPTLSSIGAVKIEDEWVTDMDVEVSGEFSFHYSEEHELIKLRRQSRFARDLLKTRYRRERGKSLSSSERRPFDVSGIQPDVRALQNMYRLAGSSHYF